MTDIQLQSAQDFDLAYQRIRQQVVTRLVNAGLQRAARLVKRRFANYKAGVLPPMQNGFGTAAGRQWFDLTQDIQTDIRKDIPTPPSQQMLDLLDDIFEDMLFRYLPALAKAANLDPDKVGRQTTDLPRFKREYQAAPPIGQVAKP